MEQQAWTTTELEAFEVLELPTREAFTGLGGGLIKINLGLCLNLNVDVDVDLDIGGDCDNDCD